MYVNKDNTQPWIENTVSRFMYLKNQDSNSRVRPKSVISTRKRFEH